jgi:hypothetical protein
MPGSESMNYQVNGNTFEQSKAGMQFSNIQRADGLQDNYSRGKHGINSYFINVSQDNNSD